MRLEQYGLFLHSLAVVEHAPFGQAMLSCICSNASNSTRPRESGRFHRWHRGTGVKAGYDGVAKVMKSLPEVAVRVLKKLLISFVVLYVVNKYQEH
ncbi:hypothetical protein O9992_05345 [Vibrio lentus]|nr:hypothetical protein [Vibrio lentus]